MFLLGCCPPSGPAGRRLVWTCGHRRRLFPGFARTVLYALLSSRRVETHTNTHTDTPSHKPSHPLSLSLTHTHPSATALFLSLTLPALPAPLLARASNDQLKETLETDKSQAKRALASKAEELQALQASMEKLKQQLVGTPRPRPPSARAPGTGPCAAHVAMLHRAAPPPPCLHMAQSPRPRQTLSPTAIPVAATQLPHLSFSFSRNQGPAGRQ